MQERFKDRRAVAKSRVFLERHEDVCKERAKRTTHNHVINLLINTIIESKVAVFDRKR